jgi:hypothetical protein
MSRGLIYPYTQIDGRFRPIIPIEIANNTHTIRYEVLVDSGADTCIIPGDIGRAIGLDIEDGEEFELGGVTGDPQIGYFHMFTLKVGKHSLRTKVGFMDTMREGAFGMVGQKGFFDRFAIKFDYAERKVILHKKQWVI